MLECADWDTRRIIFQCSFQESNLLHANTTIQCPSVSITPCKYSTTVSKSLNYSIQIQYSVQEPQCITPYKYNTVSKNLNYSIQIQYSVQEPQCITPYKYNTVSKNLNYSIQIQYNVQEPQLLHVNITEQRPMVSSSPSTTVQSTRTSITPCKYNRTTSNGLEFSINYNTICKNLNYSMWIQQYNVQENLLPKTNISWHFHVNIQHC